MAGWEDGQVWHQRKKKKASSADPRPGFNIYVYIHIHIYISVFRVPGLGCFSSFFRGGGGGVGAEGRGGLYASETMPRTISECKIERQAALSQLFLVGCLSGTVHACLMCAHFGELGNAWGTHKQATQQECISWLGFGILFRGCYILKDVKEVLLRFMGLFDL